MSVEFQPPSEVTEVPILALVEPTNPQINVIGTGFEITAHVFSGARAVGGVLLSQEIRANPHNYQSWRAVGKYVCLAAADALDGFLARRGRRMQHKDESVPRPINGLVDDVSDKAMNDSIQLAIADAEAAQGNVVYASVVKAAGLTTIARDVAVTGDRLVAMRQGIDTRAQLSGKHKAFKQYAVGAFALSPLSKSKVGKAVAGTGFLYAAEQSVKSGWSLHKYFQEQRHARRQGLHLVELEDAA